MKKLALIKKDFHPLGGLEKVTARILNGLIKKEADVTLFTASSSRLPSSLAGFPTKNSDEILTQSGASLRARSYKPRGFLKSQKLLDFDRWLSHKLCFSPFDVILSMDRCSIQTHHRAGNGVHAAYLNIRPQLEGRFKKWSFSLNPLHRIHLQLEKETFESPHTQVIIVNSAMVQKQILDYYKTSAAKIHIVHNGVEWQELETDFNHSMSHRHEHAAALGLDPSVFQFLFVGHNFRRKGLRTLLRALSLLSNKNFHLSVVGEDKEMASYQLLASHLGLESHITFFGAQASSRSFYLAADALVIPSVYDPFANVTIEALALGLFVISSKMNGGHEVLQPHSGIIIDNPQDVEELAAALDKALAHPKSRTQANLIRLSVAHLDYQLQLEKICKLCLG